MSHLRLPGDDEPRRDDTSDAAPADKEAPQVADRSVRWWAKDLGASPVYAVGIAVGAVVAVFVAVYVTTPRKPAPPPQPFVAQAPPAPPGAAGDPSPVSPVEPGMECAISKPRRSSGLFSGFGGQPALQFDYAFPGGRSRGGHVVVIVVTEPGGEPATTGVSALTDDTGTMSVAPLDIGNGFPRGTTVYLGDPTGAGPAGLPKRVSNMLTLE